MNVPLVETQSEIVPIQRRFLEIAANEHEEDASNTNVPAEAKKYM